MGVEIQSRLSCDCCNSWVSEWVGGADPYDRLDLDCVFKRITDAGRTYDICPSCARAILRNPFVDTAVKQQIDGFHGMRQ